MEPDFMKTLKLKLQPLCVNVLSLLFYSLWQLPLQGLQSGLAQITTRFYIPKTIVHVYKDLLAGIVALVKSFTASRRIYVGLGVMMVVAPLSYYSFMLFDKGHHIRLAGIDICGWFHHNYWHLFFLIRFHIGAIVFLNGLYLVLSKNPLAKFISVVVGFITMDMIGNILAKNNDDICDTFSLNMLAAGIAVSIVFFLLIDWLTHRKFHRADAFDARIELIYQNGDDFGAEKAWSMFKTAYREKKEFERR